MTVAQIKDWLQVRDGQVTLKTCSDCVRCRASVRQLVERYDQTLFKCCSELQRRAMWQLEKQAWAVSLGSRCGRGGRGPGWTCQRRRFSQPVPIIGVTIRSCQKEAGTITAAICEQSIGIGIRISIASIYNILQHQTSYAATVQGLPQTPDLTLVDGNLLPDWGFASRAVVGGDGRSCSIAAASIVAKVTRDRLMVELDSVYPGYGFKRHKGYPSREHYQALHRLGPCPIHRQSFLRKFYEVENHES